MNRTSEAPPGCAPIAPCVDPPLLMSCSDQNTMLL